MFFNAVTKDADFYPTTRLTEFLKHRFAQTGANMLGVGYAMPANLGTWYGFSQVREYDSIGMRSYESFRKSIDPVHGATETFSTDLNFNDLRFAGIGSIMATKTEAAVLRKKHPELKPVFQYENFVVLGLPVLPRAFLLPVAHFEEAKTQLTKLRKNWKAVPIRVVRPSKPWGSAATEQNLFLEYTAPKPSFLVLNQAFMPGWSGRVTDGAGSSDWITTQGVGVVKVLPVPAGSHRIEMAYRPASLRWGMGIFALAALIWLLLLAVCLKMKVEGQNNSVGL